MQFLKFLKIVLLPFSLLYGLITGIRNWFYNVGVLKSTSFPLPVIAVGNLTTGGTGKTPHVEYLIRLLKNNYKVATLSRGYGRKTKGFMIVSNPASTSEVGDEPMQYYSKFSDVIVAVGEKRKPAIEKLLQLEHKPNAILMDDAFQHRAVKPGLNILLTEYDSVFKWNFMLPTGSLREWASGIKRADIIVVSKSPEILVPIERKRVAEKFHLLPHQQLFFSFLKYGDLIRFDRAASPKSSVAGNMQPAALSGNYYFEKRFTILLVTGIANPSTMTEYLRRRTEKLKTIFFPDHHEFTKADISRIVEEFNNIHTTNKIIITTEKDAMRLRNPEVVNEIQSLPFFYLPVEVRFHHDDKELFDNMVLKYVKNSSQFTVHSSQQQPL